MIQIKVNLNKLQKRTKPIHIGIKYSNLNTVSTSTTTQPFTITRALKPIINNTVRPI